MKRLLFFGLFFSVGLFFALGYAAHGQSSELSEDQGEITESEESSILESQNSSDEANNSSTFLLIDGSGSMQEILQEDSKIDLVKDAIDDALVAVDESVDLSIWGYGNSVSSQQRQESCEDVSELFPVENNQDANPRDIVRDFSPLGNSPLAYSLGQMYQDIETASARQPVSLTIVLDGIDNCAGNPQEALTQIASLENVSISIVAIGAAQDAEEIRGYAAAGNAELFVISADDDTSSIIGQSLRSLRGRSRGNTLEVAGGRSFAEARVFSDDLLGESLSIDDHLRPEEFSYFKLSLEPGQSAEIEIETSDKDVQFDGDEPQITEDEPSAGLTVFSGDQEELFDISIQQKKNSRSSGIIYSVSAEKKRHDFFIGVGYVLPVHEDMTFSIDIVEEYDEAVGESDAPNDFDERLVALTKGSYQGFLSQNDSADYYRVPVRAGQELTLNLDPDEAQDFALELYDSSGEQVAFRAGEAPGDRISATVASDIDQEIIVGVRQGLGAYSLLVNIVAGEVDVPAAPISTSETDLIDPTQATDGGMTVSTIVALVGIAVVLFAAIVGVVFLLLRFKKRSEGKNFSLMPDKSSKKNHSDESSITKIDL